MAYDRLTDGTDAAPRLRVQQTWWGMNKLPMNSATEWTLEEKLTKVAGAGFEGLEAWLTPDIEEPIASGCKSRGLHLALGHRPYKPEDTKKVVEQALRVGAAYIMAQPADAYTSLKDVVTLVTEGRKMANDAGLCYFVETHRGNFTETIPQTLALIEAVPDIRITADLSHFVVVGEFYGWDDERAHERMMPILERVAHIHGRISNGEQVQVDCGDGSTPWARFFVKLWTIAIKNWLTGASPGDILPFSSELGPPRYAITTPDGKEISDRWEQAILMGKLIREAWTAASES
ncbi:MAG: sugar phosphate isomerase/epimerase [Armatimonas sp.]